VKKIHFILFIAVLLLITTSSAGAQVVWTNNAVFVRSCEINGEDWLFLPSGTQVDCLYEDGEAFVFRDAKTEQAMPDVYTTVAPSGKTLHVMTGECLRSVHLFSDDPEKEGRKWLEKCDLHEKETTGSIVILNADGSMFLDMELASLRGRGNSTWQKAENKKPYQFKLFYAVDVLDTGISSEKSRTWALLAHDDQDRSFLRNQIALDLALEMGLESTPRCEQVDLYYDGDYRGTYLLTEKIDVGDNGVDVIDFDKLLKPINQKYGAPDPDTLPHPTCLGNVPPKSDAMNEYGHEMGWADGVYDNEVVDAGGYLLEITSFGTLSDQGWFRIPDGLYVSVKNPEYAGETMLRYVSQLFTDMYDALMNYGFHPITGAGVETFVDVDSYVRSHLIYELMQCEDAYKWSSTFFVLPEGESRFYAGPVWDFDRCYENVPRLKDDNPFSRAFYRTTVFQQAAREICKNELAPMIENILLGRQKGRYLQPFSVYSSRLNRSWRMNYYRFFAQAQGTLNVPSAFKSALGELQNALYMQSAFLFDQVEKWGTEEREQVEINFLLPCGNPKTDSAIELKDELYGTVFLKDVEFVCVREATEEEYGVWRANFIFCTKPDAVLVDELSVTVNGETFTVVREGDRLCLVLEYEDPTYRPAVLDGVDYGYVFDYEYYIEENPDLLDICGDDRDAVLVYFRDKGMDMGDAAIEHFDPMLICDSDPHAVADYGSNWRKYYKAFMESPGKWMEQLDYVYEPVVVQVK